MVAAWAHSHSDSQGLSACLDSLSHRSSVQREARSRCVAAGSKARKRLAPALAPRGLIVHVYHVVAIPDNPRDQLRGTDNDARAARS